VPNEQGLMQSYLNFLMVGKIPDGVSLSQCYKNIIKFAEKKDHGFLVLLVFRDLYRRIFQDENENTEELMPIFNLLLNKLILPRFNMSGRKSCSMEHKVILEQRLLECFDKKVKETDKPKNHLDVQDKIFYRECLYFIKPKKISDSKIMSRVNALELLCEMGKSNELTYKEQNAVDKKKLFASLCGKDKPIRIFDLESEVVNLVLSLIDCKNAYSTNHVSLIANLQFKYCEILYNIWVDESKAQNNKPFLPMCKYQIKQYIQSSGGDKNSLLIRITHIFCKWLEQDGKKCILSNELRKIILNEFRCGKREGFLQEPVKLITKPLQYQMLVNGEVNDDKIRQEMFRGMLRVINDIDKRNISKPELIKCHYAYYKILDFIGDENDNMLRDWYATELVSLLKKVCAADNGLSMIKQAFNENENKDAPKNGMK